MAEVGAKAEVRAKAEVGTRLSVRPNDNKLESGKVLIQL